MVVNSIHQIFSWNGGGWSQLPGAATDVAVGANGSEWAIGTKSVAGGYQIFQWNGSNWTLEPGGAVEVAAGPDGSAMVVNSIHQIFSWNGHGWSRLPRTATDVAVGANGSEWAIGTTSVAGGYQIFQWSGSNWTLEPGGAVDVAVGPNGSAVVVNSINQVFDWGLGTPFSSTAALDPNWAGYVDTGETYTFVSGTWQVPNASCGFGQVENSATWVGLDGSGSGTVEQIGTDSNCAVLGGAYWAWFEMAPANPEVISGPSGDQVSAGDTMNAMVQYTGTPGYYDLQIQDVTKGWTFSTTQFVAGATGASAEWVTENPTFLGFPLTDFSPVTFTNCTAGGSDLSVYDSAISQHPNTVETMFNPGGAAASVSALSNGGSQFTITWQHG
jgi:hypothetical protein